MSELFPDPEAPVTQTNCPSGISTRMFLRLFWRAPRTTSDLPLRGRRRSGIPMDFLPLRYLPVSDLPSLKTFFERPLGHDLAAMHARAGTDLQDMIGGPNRVRVVLDNDHGIAQVAQPLERLDHLDVVLGMQPDAGFVEYVEHSHEAGTDLRRQPDTLRFAALKASPSGDSGSDNPGRWR